VFTDPQAVAVGATSGRFSGTAHLAGTPRAATYAERPGTVTGFVTLLSDGERLTGGYAVGPLAGEWLQQVTLAVRAGVPLEVLRDTIQPFPTFSQAVGTALTNLLDQLRSSDPSAR
jgi:dihydrolipoamide dehydrogenase